MLVTSIMDLKETCGKPLRFITTKWDEGLFGTPLFERYRLVPGGEDVEKEGVEEGAGSFRSGSLSSSTWPSALQTITYLAAAFLLGWLGWELGISYEHQRSIAEFYTSTTGVSLTANQNVHTDVIDETNQQRFAFATFLSEYVPAKGTDPSDDNYFVQARILTYQFLHDPLTKTDPDIPFLVLVTPEVEEWKKEQLRRDGAQVIPIPKVEMDWHFEPRWKDVISKLQLFNLEDYDKICFLDADTTLVAPMTGVFSDPGARVRATGTDATKLNNDETPLPPTYLMGAKSEASGHIIKHLPPVRPGRLHPRTQNSSSPDYLNAGFLVFKPSKLLFKYYLSVLPHYERYNVLFPEQNLWNYAHRREGNMPWTSLRWDWNVFGAKDADLEYGIKSMHGRIWTYGDSERKEFWAGKKQMMENFFRWREEVREEEGLRFKDPMKATLEDVMEHNT